AIIELDALADPVRPAAEDHDLLLVRGRALVGGGARERRLIGRIHIGGGGSELGRAGVDALEHRADAERMARALVGRPLLRIFCSISTMPRISCRNQGSILQELKMSSLDQPSRMA